MSILSSRKLPSERRFGLTIAAAFALLGIRGMVGHRSSTAYVAYFVVAIVLCLLALARPRALALLNEGWFYLGEMLGKIVSPIVMGIIFFGILAPISIVARIFGRDELRLRRRAVSSYWAGRKSLGAADSFKNQF